MNKLILKLFLIMSPIFSQTKAITSSGEIVILNDNGTWKFEEKAGAVFNKEGWEVKYFVDEFGDSTKNGYITSNYIKGKFSNSATTNSELFVYFMITKNKVSFELSEYGSSVVKATSKFPKKYYIYLKHNGEKIKNRLWAKNTSNRVYVEPKKATKYLLELLFEGGDFNMVVDEIGDYASSSYNVKFNADGLKEVYSNLYPD